VKGVVDSMFIEVAEVISRITKKDIATILPSSTIKEMEIDSVTMLEIILNLEATYGVEFDATNMAEYQTVEDFVIFIESTRENGERM